MLSKCHEGIGFVFESPLVVYLKPRGRFSYKNFSQFANVSILHQYDLFFKTIVSCQLNIYCGVLVNTQGGLLTRDSHLPRGCTKMNSQHLCLILRPHSHYTGFILYHILHRIRYQNFTCSYYIGFSSRRCTHYSAPLHSRH